MSGKGVAKKIPFLKEIEGWTWRKMRVLKYLRTLVGRIYVSI